MNKKLIITILSSAAIIGIISLVALQYEKILDAGVYFLFNTFGP